MREIEVVGRELEIKHDGRVRRSPVPEGFAPATFRHIIAAIDVLYRRDGIIPTAGAVVREWGALTLPAVKKAFAAPETRAALSLRGIEWDENAGLTSEQMYVITMLQDPTDKRTTGAKLKAIGVPMARYQAWMRNPNFSGVMNRQAEHNLGDAVQMALNKLVSNAETGDQRAIEKILEMTGRWNPQQQEVQNAKTVVLTFMEVIQAEITDKEHLARIMSKVREKMDVLSITQGLKELS